MCRWFDLKSIFLGGLRPERLTSNQIARQHRRSFASRHKQPIFFFRPQWNKVEVLANANIRKLSLILYPTAYRYEALSRFRLDDWKLPVSSMGYHDTRKMVIIIVTVVMFVVMAAFNGLAASSDGAGIFFFFSRKSKKVGQHVSNPLMLDVDRQIHHHHSQLHV